MKRRLDLICLALSISAASALAARAATPGPAGELQRDQNRVTLLYNLVERDCGHPTLNQITTVLEESCASATAQGASWLPPIRGKVASLPAASSGAGRQLLGDLDRLLRADKAIDLKGAIDNPSQSAVNGEMKSFETAYRAVLADFKRLSP